MRVNKVSHWLVAFGVVAGCNAKLSVEAGTGGAGGSAGGGDTSAGTAGRAPTEQAGGAGLEAHAGQAGELETNGGSGGDGGAPPGPGALGQSCIPGADVDSGSGVSATKITTLDRCLPGLSCSGARKCTAIPNCPNTTGECVEYRRPGSSGTGGADGAGPPGGNGAFGGTGGLGPIATPDEWGVTAMAIDSSRLYWTEYGTRDSVGNYQNDGALMTMKLADRTTVQLGRNLAGPNALALTSSHAYVVIDGAGLVGAVSHPQLLRLSLAEGASEVIQAGTPPVSQLPPTSFAAAGETMYWSGTGTYFSLASGSTTPEAGTSSASSLHTDSSDLYFVGAANQMFRTSLTGDGMVETLALGTRPFDLNGDSIYGLERANVGMILTKATKIDGSWLRIRALGELYPARLVFAGDRLFAEWADDLSQTGLTTTTLSSTAPPVRLFDAGEASVSSWVGTSNKLYWSDGSRIYSRPIPTP